MKPRISRAYTPAAVLAAVLALGAPTMAVAGDGHHNGACSADIQTLCPGADTHDAVRSCLQEHKDQLSEACAQKIEARRQRHMAVRNACGTDLASLCPDAQGRDIPHCLFEHRSELSETCTQTLESFHHHCSEQAPS